MFRNKTTEFLGDHPRLAGALLTVCVLLTTVGSALAGTGGANSGP